MRAIVTALDSGGADYAVTIPICPRGTAATALELHDTALADEARFAARGSRFVTIEHAENSWARDAINIADDVLATRTRTYHRGIWPQIVKPATRERGTDIPRRATQPLRHRNLDEWPQRAIGEQQRIASRRS